MYPIFYLRHSEPTNSKSGLSKAGELQAKNLYSKLLIELTLKPLIFHSPTKRTTATANIIKTNLDDLISQYDQTKIQKIHSSQTPNLDIKRYLDKENDFFIEMFKNYKQLAQQNPIILITHEEIISKTMHSLYPDQFPKPRIVMGYNSGYKISSINPNKFQEYGKIKWIHGKK